MLHPGHIFSWLAAFATRRPRTALAVAMVGCLVLAAPALTLKLEVDLVRLLPEGSPAVQRFRELADSFGATDQAFLAVEINDPSRPADAAVRAQAGTLVDTLADEMCASRWTPPGSSAPEPLLRACDGRSDPGWSTALLDRVGVETWRLLDDQRLDLLIKRLQPRVVAKRVALGPPPDLPVNIAERDLLAVWRDCYLPFWQERIGASVSVQRDGGRLVAQGGRFHLLLLRPARPAHDRPFTLAFTESLQAMAERAHADPHNVGLTVHVVGGHFIAAADYRTARSAALGNMWQGIVGVALLLALGFRSWRVPVLVAVALLPATAAAYGAARLLCGPDVSLVVAAFTAALIGLGDDVLIHLLSAFGRHVGANPDRAERAAAAKTSAHELATTVVAGVATTVAAIAVLGLSEFRGLRQLGAMAAAGLAIILVQLFVVVPAVLTLWGWQVRSPSAAGYARRVPIWRWPLIVMLSLLVAATVATLAGDGPLFRFDSRARALRPAHDPVFDEQARLATELALPIDQVQFLISGLTRDAVAETGAQLVAAARPLADTPVSVLMEELGAQLPDQVMVRGVTACHGPRLFTTSGGRLRAEHVEDGRLRGLRWLDGPPTVTIPAGSDLTMRPLLLAPSESLSLASPSRQRQVMARLRQDIDWPGIDRIVAGLSAADQAKHARFIADLAIMRDGVNADRALTPGDLLDSPLGSAVAAVWSEREGHIRLAVRLRAPDVGIGLSVTEVCAELGVVRDGGPWRVAGTEVAATGIQVLSEALGERLIVDLRRLAGWAGLAVVGLVLLLGGGWRSSLAVLTALFSSALLTMAGMHACGLAWNPMNAAAAPLLLGMGVDAALFMVHALGRQPRTHAGVREALDEAVMPALLSSGTTMLGFATLMLNPYRGIQSLGLLVVVGLGSSLFVALVAIPAIAAVTTHRRHRVMDTDTAIGG